ncbi:CD70 antigen [Sorex araneus]|uniref:CD70 antigen n=1 Tax=Sorex araneus TaxID=42254 RepID=UPI00033191C7|nr:CD70 antigen [Sorex araneus]
MPVARERYAVPRARWTSVVRVVILMLPLVAVCCFLFGHFFGQKSPAPTGDTAIGELHLNHTGPRLDPRLPWHGNPALGRAFLHGLQVDDRGQVYIQVTGIYRLHIQVTLANCTSSSRAAARPGPTLVVAICNPGARPISLLRLPFLGDCFVASQRLTRLLQGDTLCSNLTLPFLPSANSDASFFGLHWVHQ